VRYLKGMRMLCLPRGLAIGDLVAYANERLTEQSGISERFTFAGAGFFERMKERGLYSTDSELIMGRVKRYELSGIYNERLV